MSRFSTMPRAYRMQLEREDQQKVQQATKFLEDNLSTGSAGRLRGIPAIGRNCPGHIRDTDPLGYITRSER